MSSHYTHDPQSVKYKITFSTRWGDPDYGIGYPQNSHIGNMFLAVHNTDFKLFEVGELSTDGVSNNSMFGITNDLEKDAYTSKNVLNYYTMDVLIGPGEKIFDNIIMDNFYDNVSFCAMIAPSPDWFVGVSNLQLKNKKGQWKDNLIVPMWAYDAGTDYGSGFYNDPDFPEPIRKPIKFITDGPLFSYNPPKPIAYLIFKII